MHRQAALRCKKLVAAQASSTRQTPSAVLFLDVLLQLVLVVERVIAFIANTGLMLWALAAMTLSVVGQRLRAV